MRAAGQQEHDGQAATECRRRRLEPRGPETTGDQQDERHADQRDQGFHWSSLPWIRSVAAAADLLETTGDESAVTLRAIARRIGVTAPSIYPHFDDREQILAAAVDSVFPRLVNRLLTAADALAVPADERSLTRMTGADAFSWLVDAIRSCVDAGRSTATDPTGSAVQLWVALHGYATLRAAANDFPWPDEDGLLDDLITRLACTRVSS